MPYNWNDAESAHEQPADNSQSTNSPHRLSISALNHANTRFWYNSELKKAICFLDAEDKDVLERIAVDEASPAVIVEISAESFGRIAEQLNTLHAIRGEEDVCVILCRKISQEPIELEESKRFVDLMKEFDRKTKKMVFRYGGEWLSSKGDYVLVHFNNLKKAVECSLELRQVFDQCRKKIATCKVSMNIGLSLDLAEKSKLQPSEASVKLARRLAFINSDSVIISHQLSDKKSGFRNEKFIRLLSYKEEKFVNKLMDCLEQHWQNENFQVEDIGKQLGCSKSKIYRQIMDLMEQSPNQFIKEYRLNRAIDMIRARRSNISEIAFESGFGSPSYFSRCFQKRFGLNPTDFIQAMQV